MYAKWTEIPEPINYKIIKGANSTWIIKNDEEPLFRSNADFDKFDKALLDGELLDPSYYRAESGSTIVTLKPEFALSETTMSSAFIAGVFFNILIN